jgi:hypothetical protein
MHKTKTMLSKIEVIKHEDSAEVEFTLPSGRVFKIVVSDKCDFFTLTTDSGGMVIRPQVANDITDQTKFNAQD